MKQFKLLLITTLMLVLSNELSAHALWIETPTIGKIGEKQEINVFYGEYSSNEREEISKWYSDVKDFSLWLTAPGREKIKLTTTPGSNSYSASFTPDKEGVYFLTISHEAKELGGTTRYEFLSHAAITVGKPATIQAASVPSILNVMANELKLYQINVPVKFTAVQNGKILAKKKVSVYSPAGWTNQFTTDDQGQITFTPLWSGRYVLEVENYQKVTGEHHGKAFDASWQGATSTFEVIK